MLASGSAGHLAYLTLLVGLGAAFGFLRGLFGMGGGTVAIPVLGVFFDMSEQVAQGTSLVMVVPNVLVGLWQYYRRGGMNPKLAISLGAGAVPFTYVGAKYATHLPSGPLRAVFIVFILGIAAYMGWRTFGRGRIAARSRPWPWPYATVAGMIGGALSGLFSIGDATFAVPAMTVGFGLTQAVAQGMALVAPGTVAGIVTYAGAGDVDWAVGLPLALGGVFGVSLGVPLAHRFPDRTLRGLFIGFLLFAAAGLALKI
jgi:uncharacterized membrane protein YfcA